MTFRPFVLKGIYARVHDSKISFYTTKIHYVEIIWFEKGFFRVPFLFANFCYGKMTRQSVKKDKHSFFCGCLCIPFDFAKKKGGQWIEFYFLNIMKCVQWQSVLMSFCLPSANFLINEKCLQFDHVCSDKDKPYASKQTLIMKEDNNKKWMKKRVCVYDKKWRWRREWKKKETQWYEGKIHHSY